MDEGSVQETPSFFNGQGEATEADPTEAGERVYPLFPQYTVASGHFAYGLLYRLGGGASAAHAGTMIPGKLNLAMADWPAINAACGAGAYKVVPYRPNGRVGGHTANEFAGTPVPLDRCILPDAILVPGSPRPGSVGPVASAPEARAPALDPAMLFAANLEEKRRKEEEDREERRRKDEAEREERRAEREERAAREKREYEERIARERREHEERMARERQQWEEAQAERRRKDDEERAERRERFEQQMKALDRSASKEEVTAKATAETEAKRIEAQSALDLAKLKAEQSKGDIDGWMDLGERVITRIANKHPKLVEKVMDGMVGEKATEAARVIVRAQIKEYLPEFIGQATGEAIDEVQAAFIANPERLVPVMEQALARNPEAAARVLQSLLAAVNKQPAGG